MNLRADIQGLRAIAILLVILSHSGVDVLQGGFVGVDVFFVLSGFLITGQIVSEVEAQGRFSFAGFYARRLKRLLPALSFVLVVVALLVPSVLSVHGVAEQMSSLAYAATWTSNLYFAFTEVNYFSELRNRDLFIHTWSLGLEQQFYLVWPLLLYCAHARFAPMGAAHGRRSLGFLVSVIFASSLMLSWWGAWSHSMTAYYLLPTRIWQFALGAGVWLLCADSKGALAARLPWQWLHTGGGCSVIGLLLILAAALYVDNQTPYPGLLALLPSMGAAMVLAAMASQAPSRGRALLSASVLQWVGDRSYSWYLWHWPVFMVGFEWGMKGSRYAVAALVVLSLLLAAGTYRFVELPFWKGRWRGMPTRHVFLLSILAMLTPIAVHWNYGAYQPQEPSASVLVARQIKDTGANDTPAIYAQGCDSSLRNADLQPCFVGAQDASKTVVLVGDSISAQWISMLPLIFEPPHWRVVLLTKSSCPMVDEDVRHANGQIFSICKEWRDKVLLYLPLLKPDVVMIGSAASYGFTASQWVDGTTRVLERLTALAPRTIVIAGTPKLSFNGPECLQRQLSNSGGIASLASTACNEKLTTTQAADVAIYLARSVSRFKSAMLLNLNDLVCPNQICLAKLQEGVVVFRDSQHLTDSFAKQQAHVAKQRVFGRLQD